MMGVREIALISLIAAAAWSDLRTRRIPNWLTVTGAVLGLCCQAWERGLRGAATSLASTALALAIFLVLYIAAGMGAGDVKLFGAVGAFVNPWTVVLIFVFTGLLGGAAGLGMAIMRGQLRQTLDRTSELMFNFGLTEQSRSDALRLPYGAVVAGGVLISLWVS
jgi:prepilin peptidase CpaA